MTHRKQDAIDVAGATRRVALKLAGAALAMPAIWIPRAHAATQVLVRTPGGAYDEIRREVVYEPFRKTTGIEVVPVAANMAKLFAMFKSGNVELDVIDTGDWPLVQFQREGALAPIPYGEFRYTKPEDIDPQFKREYHVGTYVYASVMAYNAGSFTLATGPKNWAEFWDDKRFPGARMLSDLNAGAPDLEFALLADGVPRDQLYPLDIERALRSMARLRPSIRKFWDSGALPAQMLADKEVALGSIWSNRAYDVIRKGAPVTVNWNEHMVLVQALGIAKGARNMDGAKKFVDYCMSPDVQRNFAMKYSAGPSNTKAHAALPKEVLETVAGGEMSRRLGFVQNAEWWAANRTKVAEAWSRFVLNR